LLLEKRDVFIAEMPWTFPAPKLDSDELEEYSTVLLLLQKQIETGEPSERVVKKCLAYLERFQAQAA
jgi:hypothetical protein